MLVTSILAVLGLGLLVVVVPRLLRRARPRARAHVPRVGGVLVMRMPRRYGIMLGVSALFPAALLGGIALRALTGPREGTGVLSVAATVLATLAALAVAVHQFTAAFRGRFVVDEFGLSRIGVLTRRRMRWGEVASVVFNPVNRWFFLTAADGTHLWVPVDTHGIGDFAAVALARLPHAALTADENARDALEDLAAAGKPSEA